LTSIALSKDLYLYGRKGETNHTFAEGTGYVKEHQDYFGLPTLVLIWGWEKKGAWSSGEYFPPYEGWGNFDKMIQEIHKLDSKTWVFISANSIITASEQWRNGSAKNYARVKEDGTYQISSGPNLVWEPVEMCPHTDYWKSTLKSYVLTLAEHGVDLIQFDGFPWCGPSECYNFSHNHPLGRGGNLWAKTWINFLSGIKQEAGRINPEVAFAGEGGAEIFIPFLDVFHSRDSWTLEIEYEEIAGKGASVIPLFRYVYNDHPVMIGQHNPSLTDFLGGSSHNALGFARILVWGEVGSYNFQASMFDPHLDKPLIDYLKKISWARATYARKFFLNSTMIKPQEISSPRISVVTEKQRSFNANAIQYSAWKSADNTIGYILTNIWNQTRTVKVNLNLTEHGLTEPCFAYYVKDGEYHYLGVVSSIFNSTFPVDPLGILLIAFSQSGPPSPPAYTYSIMINGLLEGSTHVYLDNEAVTTLSNGQSYEIAALIGSHTISVDPVVNCEADTRYVCPQSSVNISNGGFHIFEYRLQYYLTVQSNPPIISAIPLQSDWYDVGQQITVSTSSGIEKDFLTDYVFEGWRIDGEIVSTSPTYSFVMNGPITLVASWRTVINLNLVGAMIGIILLIVVIMVVILKRRKRTR